MVVLIQIPLWCHHGGFCEKILIIFFVFLLAPDKKQCWMAYVNCPNTEENQNLFVCQYRSKIYYCLVWPIPPGTEMFMYYGDLVLYARSLAVVPFNNSCRASKRPYLNLQLLNSLILKAGCNLTGYSEEDYKGSVATYYGPTTVPWNVSFCYPKDIWTPSDGNNGFA